jgi:hypothetical protein
MKFVMFTYAHREAIDQWEAMTAEEQRALVDEHVEWFREHADHVTGGTELAYPPDAVEVRRVEGRLSVVDGPFAETKELLGGVIDLEADSLEEATRIASRWPNLNGPGNRVVVSAVARPRELD